MDSVSRYASKHGIEYRVLTTPKLRIKPDPFMSNRSEESWKKHGGFLPIYEKENAFDLLDEYDQIAIIDADIFIRDDAPNIFEDFGTEHEFGACIEREMPITYEYQQKIINYSRMQYSQLQKEVDFKPNHLGYEFANMGMILLNCAKFKPNLFGQTAYEFLNRSKYARFVNGEGAWKWSTDQTLLNFFIKDQFVTFKNMHWKWNGLYTANIKIEECHFVHFFLKDKLPKQGEDVKSLMGSI